MKKLILAFALIAGTTQFTFAQDAKQAPKEQTVNPDQYAERSAREVQRMLQLNEDQYRQIFEIDLRTYNETMAVKNGNDKNQGRLAAIRKEKDDEMKKILTPDQYKRLQSWKDEKHQKADQDYNQRMTDKMKDKQNPKASAPSKAEHK